VQVSRERWVNDAELGEVERLVFFDESGVNLSMTRTYARAPRAWWLARERGCGTFRRTRPTFHPSNPAGRR
jgi:hypothetical protein